MNDQQLLARYAADRSPDTFAAIVHANIDLVYAAARRQLQDSHLAEDVTQGVFLLLSQKPRTIKGPLAGWLIKATYYCCRDAKKLAARRAHHERQAMTMRPILDSASSAEPAVWETYAPLLDDALLRLRAKDRNAVTLRYLKGLSLHDVGAVLGISDEAARKRVDRALEHLHAQMAVKAAIPPASALTVAIAALPMHAAPAGLADSITGGVAAKSALASAISQTGAKWMGWTQLKTIGAVAAGVATCAAASGAYLVVAFSHHPVVAISAAAAAFPVSAPAPVAAAVNPDEDETHVPGVVFVASWDLLLTPEGADAVGKVLHHVKTSSVSYTGATANGVALRRAVRQAMNDSQVAGISQSMMFYPGLISSQSDIILSFRTGYMNYDHGHALISGGSEGPERGHLVRIDNDHLSLKLDFPNIGVQINDTDSSNWSENVKSVIAYEGTLAAGDAVAFLGKYTALSGKTYAHLVVWETFKADQTQMDMRPGRDVRWWCDNGPSPLRAWANEARVWRAQSSGGTTVAPAFLKTLEDGKVLQLEMLSRPSQWPYCWWDAQGNPATGASRGRISPLISFTGDPPEGLWALVSVHSDDPEEKKLPNPLRPMQGGSPLYDEQECREVDDASGSLDMGVAVGAWKQIGTLELNKPQTINGVRYRITQPDQFSPDTFLVHFLRSGVLENEDLLIPTAADGRAASTQEDRTIVFDRPTEETRKETQPNFRGISVAEVKTWRLMQRKREWVTFANIATMPKMTPSASVTTADADAADRIFEERKRQAGSMELAAQRKEWAAIPPDRTTAHGAIRKLVDAIRAGDESAAADLMFTAKPMGASCMAGLVRYYVVQEQARQAVAEAIGRDMPESELSDLTHIILVKDVESDLFNGDWRWVPGRDGPLTPINQLPVVKGADGTYRVNVDSMRDVATSVERLNSVIAMEQQVRDTLRAKRHVTLAELATIIRSPLPKATTQK